MSRWLLLAILAGGCGTVTFENQLPGATVENARIQTDDGDVLWLTTASVLPGGARRVTPGADVEGETGRLVFELVVRGRRAELETTEAFRLDDGARVVLAPDTPVRARLRD